MCVNERRFGFGFNSDWIKKWRKCFLSQPCSIVDAKPINKLTSVFHESVLLLIMNFIISNIVKVAVDPQGDSRVDPPTLTML